MTNRVLATPTFGGTSLGRWSPGVRVRALCRIGLLAMVCLGLVACSEKPPPPPLVVGTNIWLGHDPLVLAADRGLAGAEQVKVVELIASGEAVRHLRNGLLDAAAMTLDEALRLADSGFDVHIVALLATSVGADVVLAAPRIDRLDKLRGARIAMEDATVSTLLLNRLLDKARLRREDVTVVPLTASEHLTALQTGRVAAAVSYAPIDMPIRREGYRVIFDSSDMPVELMDVLLVRADVLRSRPAAVDALLEVWASGLAALQRDPSGTAAVLAPGVDLTPEQYLAAQKGLRFFTPAESLALLTGQPPRLAAQGDEVARWLVEWGVLKAVPHWADLIDAGPAMRAATRQGAQP